jgi:alpha-tubulin suppressor-like RCC1 family protein
MHQYPTETVADQDLSLSIPSPLSSFPNGLRMTEIWAGSEYCLATDEENCLWGCGWNEHGNLGIGSNETASVWQKVNNKQSNNITFPSVHFWEGSVACGGGHVVFIPYNKNGSK